MKSKFLRIACSLLLVCSLVFSFYCPEPHETDDTQPQCDDEYQYSAQ